MAFSEGEQPVEHRHQISRAELRAAAGAFGARADPAPARRFAPWQAVRWHGGIAAAAKPKKQGEQIAKDGVGFKNHGCINLLLTIFV